MHVHQSRIQLVVQHILPPQALHLDQNRAIEFKIKFFNQNKTEVVMHFAQTLPWILASISFSNIWSSSNIFNQGSSLAKI